MALKLFRHTGYSTILMPGETRQALHPGWLVLAASLWVGVACNVAVWRLDTPRAMLASAALLAGGSGMVLSVFGWRRTLKLAITVLLLAASLFACGLWIQDLPVESLWQQRPRGLLPPWPSFLRWQVLALLAVLALVPIVWVWNLQVRRLRGPQQLRANVGGAVAGAIVLGAGWLALP